MATVQLPPDFSEFLRLLNAHDVRYLLVGGYAVNYHGYVRATADMDVWVRQDPRNAERVVAALREFGFDTPELKPDLFVTGNNLVRMGVPPMRLELLTSISGVEFDECYAQRIRAMWDGVPVNVISLAKLKENKRASGRLKDLTDLERLD